MITYKTKMFLIPFLAMILAFFAFQTCRYNGIALMQACASTVLYPFLYTQNSVVSAIKNICKQHTKKNDLRNQIELLNKQNENLIAENISLLATKVFYGNTQEIVRFKERYTVAKSCLAHIIMKQCNAQDHFFLVDCGSLQGIEVDMVAVYKNCLIGRVEDVYPYYSKVRLISDRMCKIAAYCKTSHARGIHEGCNEHYSTLQFVSHLAQLTVNDIIISSGEGLVFPQGFGIGRIDSFESNGLHYNIRVKPLLKLEDLEYCYLIKKGS